jgi:hypothetical protein
MNKTRFIHLFSFCFLFFLCAKHGNADEPLEGDQSAIPPIQLSGERSSFLYCTKAVETSGELKLQNGNFMTWEGDSQLLWEVDVPKDEDYELYLIANVREEGDRTKLSFGSDNERFDSLLSPTTGPYIGGKNFQRIKLAPSIALKEGKQKLTLASSGTSKTGVVLDFRSIELLPISSRKTIDEEEARARNSRSSVDWLKEAGYGLMFHWTSQSVQPDGSIKSYQDAVNDFNVRQFCDTVEETGAGYVMLTVGHAESYCPAPIESWEKCHPGKTTKRDLIDEIADALNERGIRLICYLNGPLAFEFNKKKTPTETEKAVFVGNFENILQEMGNRYQHKIAGYWFDSWYQIFEGFPEVPFEVFYQAAKTGNDDRIICLNSWVYPAVTPWQDFWAGEVASPVRLPVDGFHESGPVTDLPYQALLIMEPYWVQKKAEMPDPRFTSARLGKYIQDCMSNGGAVTINLGIYQDGSVGEKALQVMREVKSLIRN